MKKLSLIFSLMFIVALSACKKDWTCECTYTEPFTGTTQTSSGTIEDETRGDAKDECEQAETDLKQIDSNASCELN